MSRNKYKKVVDMTEEELARELDLISRGANKYRLKNQSELNKDIEMTKEVEVSDNMQTVLVEGEGYSAVIETEAGRDVHVEMTEETDAEFGRRVRFTIKVKEYRETAEQIRAREARKPWIVKAYNKAKANTEETILNIIDRLSR